MQRPQFPWTWIALFAILLFLPSPVRRVLFEIAGGFTLLLVFLPVLAAGLGLLAWQIYRRRLRTCANCGLVSLGASQCPACGMSLDDHAEGIASGAARDDFDAGNVTIDVSVVDVDPSSSPDPTKR
jgi:hypothetical protein